MGSPLGPSFANLCHHETKWLNDCPEKFKPVFYKRYVDDTFVLFKRPEHVKPFVDYMNSKHKNIKKLFPKKQLYLVLPYMGKMSALIKSGLARSLHRRLPFCKVRIVFKTTNRLWNYFSFKDVVPEPVRSCQIYNFTFGSCSASYIGKTFRHQVSKEPRKVTKEHQGVSPRTGKHLKGILSTSVRDHMLDCNHMVAWNDFWGGSIGEGI